MGFPSDEARTGDPEFIRPFRENAFHGVHAKSRTVDQAFIFRVDALSAGRAMILVQSALRPDWEYAFQNATYLLAGPPEVKPIEHNYETGQTLLFRLRANPTRRDTNTRKREGVLGEEKQREWLVRKGQTGGFEVLSVAVTDESFRRTTRGHVRQETRPMSHLAVRYEGILRVTECDAFTDAITRGIGSAKAFGFGLLTVAPYRGG